MPHFHSRLKVAVAALLIVACVTEMTEPKPRPPASVQIVSGDHQSGPAGQELPDPLVVRVNDANGVAQAGQLVNFRVTSGGGSVFAGASLTSASGIAQERWTLGPNPGESQRVEARAVDNATGAALTFAVFTASATSGQVQGTAASCVGPAGATIGVNGEQTSPYENTSVPDNTTVDLSSAQFLTSARIAVRVGGGSSICLHGGETDGAMPPATDWSTMQGTYSMVIDGPNVTVENIRVFNRGDGVAFGSNVPNWTLRGAYIHYARDGCVENHFVFSGTVDDALLDGCFIGFASRPYTSSQDGSGNVLAITNTLVRLQPMDAVYAGPTPGHGGFFEWSAVSPMLSLHNDVFRVDQQSNDGDEYLGPPPGKLADCSNNVMIWLGSGPFPEQLPNCFTLLTGAAGLQYWNDAVARWKADHPSTLSDIGPPVVSLFAPSDGATLTGPVALTATAVDDRDVAGVQFAVDGQDLGPEITTESRPTKFTGSWDSRSVANGTHTLTATARDGAGNRTVSAAITVTVAN